MQLQHLKIEGTNLQKISKAIITQISKRRVEFTPKNFSTEANDHILTLAYSHICYINICKTGEAPEESEMLQIKGNKKSVLYT